MKPHQMICKKKEFTITVLESGQPNDDIFSKKELWIQFLTPSISTDKLGGLETQQEEEAYPEEEGRQAVRG